MPQQPGARSPLNTHRLDALGAQHGRRLLRPPFQRAPLLLLLVQRGGELLVARVCVRQLHRRLVDAALHGAAGVQALGLQRVVAHVGLLLGGGE